ncbi:MBL fold metallo-hydrolase [Aspergillus ruber CBS 135680]|uniref:Metallo-beta-lactamase superfamily protein n=1 Tax=Aspergillus ruber (strain CBS 135680) TaxID=1388766 RepID=A0A017S9D2_ASPRC|nr:metallo-beta-lactamase superfamily protein [Aspergillus ruber CBS 135680]EYE92800.1 metallo-beta-lactamase superfamily protein [Aspergillus ruber CBS 135680]
MEPIIHPAFEQQTSTWQYIVACPRTFQPAIINPVLDYDQTQMSIGTTSADALLDFATSYDYTTTCLETHAHADHLTAAYYIQQKLETKKQNKIKLSIRIKELDNAFDHLFQDDDTFQIGDITGQTLHLPGHTPDHSGYIIGSNVFTGDSIFNSDVGSARCDFPDGDAHALYGFMQKLLSLPDKYKLYTKHENPSSEGNKHVKGNTPKEDFVRCRQERDSGLHEPQASHQVLQVNIRGGKLPLSEDGGVAIE